MTQTRRTFMVNAMAAAGAISPASSMFNTATEAKLVLYEYKNTKADTVVMAFTKR